VNMTLTKPSSKIEFYIMLRNITKVVDSNYKLVLMIVRRCIVTAAESTKTVADSTNDENGRVDNDARPSATRRLGALRRCIVP